jgi:trigger factor
MGCKNYIILQPIFILQKSIKMNIRKEHIDALNAVVKITIGKYEYTEKIENFLELKRKTATIPGFRKGKTPMDVVRKQFEKPAIIEEVTALVNKGLKDYIAKEKLDLLGNALPRTNENFDWNADELVFEYELGIAPEFSVDLARASGVTRYKIIADDTLLNEQVERIQKQYGKILTETEVKNGFEINGTFSNEEKNISNQALIGLDVFADAKTGKQFIGKKVGDVITLKTKGLFTDDHKLMDYLKVAHDDVHDLDIQVNFTIDAIQSIEKAAINDELFAKLFPNGEVTTLEGLKARIKEDAEQQFVQQADQQFLNDVTEALLETTQFDLPETFLKKWIQTIGETPLTPEQAEVEFVKSERGLRYQLIESKIFIDNNLQVRFDELKDFTSGLIRQQMAQFGQANATDAEVDGIVSRVMSNQEEIKRISDQVLSLKMIDLYKTSVKAIEKEVNYQDFVKAMYGEM